jgi:hypothetical protein
LKKIISFLIGLAIIPCFVTAQVSINEIMYDVKDSDSGREWIELANFGGDPIDTDGWKFQESASSSNHTLSVIQGNSVIPSGGYAIIVIDSAKFLADWPGFSGTIFKASFSSLNNTASTLVIKNKNMEVQDQVGYSVDQGAAGDGNSLQKTVSGWVAASPTPGAKNATEPTQIITNEATSSESSNTGTNSQNSSAVGSGSGSSVLSAHSSQESLSDSSEKTVLEISGGRDRLSAAGNKIIFKAKVARADHVDSRGLFYQWSFGDGAISNGSEVSHSYEFPGRYSVILNASYGDVEAVDRLNVVVIDPKISMKKVSGGIELLNNSGAEINLQDWRLVAVTSQNTVINPFVFPADTILPVDRAIIFADKITGIVSEFVRLENPLGKIYSSTVLPEKADVPEKHIAAISTTSSISPEIEKLVGQAISETKTIISKIESENLKENINSSKNPNLNKSKKTSVTVTKSTPTKEKNTDDKTLSSTAKTQTATLFEAPVQKSFVSSLFSWPIKGVEFIRKMFVEE